MTYTELLIQKQPASFMQDRLPKNFIYTLINVCLLEPVRPVNES